MKEFKSLSCGYQPKHTLNEKKRIIAKIHIPHISVCGNVNENKDDCCNLRVNG